MKKTPALRLLFLILILGVFLTGCGDATEVSDVSGPTEHIHIWDSSVKGEFITVSYELQPVMASGANDEVYEVYVYCYFRTVDGWEYGCDSYRYKIFPVTEGKAFETWEFYDEEISIEYITEGTPRYEAQYKVASYCPDCGEYLLVNDAHYRKIYIPEGTFFIVNN